MGPIRLEGILMIGKWTPISPGLIDEGGRNSKLLFKQMYQGLKKLHRYAWHQVGYASQLKWVPLSLTIHLAS